MALPSSVFFVSLISCIMIAILSWFLTARVRAFVLRKNILDRPNERSSHTVATPRGGGLAVVATIALVVLMRILLGDLGVIWLIPTVGMLVIAALGWIDDTRGLSARIRLLVQMGVTCVVLLLMIFAPESSGLQLRGEVSVLGFALGIGTWAFPLFVLFVVWLVNLYNFMDGIDGILGIQTATVMLASAILCMAQGPQPASVAIAIAGAAIGFLAMNWHPAKIFMGDVGSAALGFFLALFALMVAISGQLTFMASIVLHAAFIGDATWTLFARMRETRKVHQAHRSHLYQKLVRSGRKHSAVAGLFGAYNVLWLFPLAWGVERAGLNGWLAVALAYAPVWILCFQFRAGLEKPAVDNHQ